VVSEGARLLSSGGIGQVHTKGDRDYVTELDIAIQYTVERRLATETPSIGFLGEEAAPEASRDDHPAEYVWTLDPIDGTSNLVHGLPLCAVSLALVRAGRPVVGVISAPFLNLEYYAVDGRGAFCNESPIRAARTSTLDGAIVSLGDYAVGDTADRENRRRIAVTEALARTTERVRMFGCAALDLAWVAQGRTDGCVIMANNSWDVAAGVVIARAAGAVVIDSDGTVHSPDSQHTIAANPALSRDLIQLIVASTESQ
jgi:myo-inositol-1(or 4)-monophosphatase